MTAKQVSFADIAGPKEEGGEGGSIKERTITVDEVLNQPLTVTKVEVVAGYQNEDLLLIYTKENPKPIRSGSKVLLKQAGDKIKKHTDAGVEVKTGIKRERSQKDKSKSYYTFV
jgi:hypothetical protein